MAIFGQIPRECGHNDVILTRTGGFKLSAGKIFVRRAAGTGARGYFGGARPGNRALAFSEIIFVVILYLCGKS